jgi:glucose-6-phosphate isomerase
MVNLEALSGLPVSLGDNGQLVFGPDVVVEEAKTRLLGELTPVAMEPEACRGRGDVAYYMYNGVYCRVDVQRLEGLPLRYELTLIPARRIGREYVKTFGHLHNVEPKSGLTYAEVCEVLVGTAHFLFQTLDVTGPSASVAFYVEARAGEKVLIPPGFDHCTINPGPDPLLLSDVIALGATGVYDRFRAAHGAAYFECVEDGAPRFVPNPAYRAAPELRKEALREYPELHLTRSEPLYTAFVQRRGENWPFLTDPGQFEPMFPELDAAI